MPIEPLRDPQHLTLAVTFALVATYGSFRRAAERLKVARSTVSDHVGRLEEGLSVRLFERTTRQLRLTQEGELLLRATEDIVDRWTAVTNVLDAKQQHPSGTLRITAPSTLSDAIVSPIVGGMLAEFPELAAEVLADDALLDVVTSGIDVALRIGRLADSTLPARRLGVERGFVAVRAESSHARALEEAGEDVEQRLKIVSELPWVGYTRLQSQIVLRDRQGSEVRTLRVRYRAHASNGHGLLRFVLEGIGVGVLSESMFVLGGSALLAPIPTYVAAAFPLWALTPARQYPVARTQVFLERLERRLRTPIWSPE
ncbi:MAG: LysR family transcriptional regulator [Myxococcota bacterium]